MGQIMAIDGNPNEVAVQVDNFFRRIPLPVLEFAAFAVIILMLNAAG